MKNLYLFIALVLISFYSYSQNIPIDFEATGNGSNWSWTVFENDDNPPLEIISNPDPTGINPSATVAKFTARSTGQPFAGCESMHGSDIGSWTIDANNSTIRIMVWKDVISDVGIKLVRSDNWSLGEIKIANTLTNQWEQLTYDFSAHIGNNYDQIVIFPDFNARSSENVIYFDNIYGVEVLPSSIESSTQLRANIYPNPASDLLNIELNATISNPGAIRVFDLAGKVLIQKESSETVTALDISELHAGIYTIEVDSEAGVQRGKFIKE